MLKKFIEFDVQFVNKIIKVEKFVDNSLNDKFMFYLDNSEVIIGTFNETSLLYEIYENSFFISGIGQEMCIVIDVMYAKGGTESIAESFYRVMESQVQSGRQSNDILELRTKLDWCLPNVAQCDCLIEKASNYFFNDDKHLNPITVLGNKSKVLSRFEKEEPRLPFIIDD